MRFFTFVKKYLSRLPNHHLPVPNSTVYTDKKANLIYIRKFRMEQLQSHTRLYEEGLPNIIIWGNTKIFNHIWGACYSYMTLQLLHSEFHYIWGKFYFIFYQCTFMTSSLTLFMISVLSEGAPLLLVVCCASWIQLTGALSRDEPIFVDKFQARDYSTSQHNILHCQYLFCPSVQGFSFTGQEVCALSSWQNQRGQFEKLFEDSVQRASHSH